MKKYLIVGAGISGATIARKLVEWDDTCRVDIIDKRDHIAGNAADETHEVGIRYHKYGPHLFHTNNKEVFEFLSRFTEWNEYYHKVNAQLEDGRLVALPVNKATKEAVGEDKVLDTFFKPYTKKMWGVELEELNPSIINRVPIRDDSNLCYFPNDKYQALPRNGYTTMVRGMIEHERIFIMLNMSFNKAMEEHYDHVFNAMPIDVYYDECFGPLPYRSIKFHHEVIDKENIDITMKSHTPTTNFTDDDIYTRYTEWSQLPNHGYNPDKTLITTEEPMDYRDNDMERYYPVKDMGGENAKRYRQYANIENDKVTFIGRCGLYTYLDMDNAVASAMKIFEKHIG